MIYTAEIWSDTSFIVIVAKSHSELCAKVAAVGGDTNAVGVVDSDDLSYAFDKIASNDWDTVIRL